MIMMFIVIVLTEIKIKFIILIIENKSIMRGRTRIILKIICFIPGIIISTKNGTIWVIFYIKPYNQ